jgi:hypothetical protein
MPRCGSKGSRPCGFRMFSGRIGVEEPHIALSRTRISNLQESVRGYEGRPATGQDRDVCAGSQCERLTVSISRPLVPGKRHHYSITSSAMASSPGGTSMPSARAVCRLMTNSNLVRRATSRSTGLASLSDAVDVDNGQAKCPCQCPGKIRGPSKNNPARRGAKSREKNVPTRRSGY